MPHLPPDSMKPTHDAKTLDTLIQLYNKVQEDQLSFCYRGEFLERFTNTILDISEGGLARQGYKPATNRKVSFLLVECFQNIVKHSEQVDEEKPPMGLFGFRQTQKAFLINSINYVQQKARVGLQALVDRINGLSDEELKELYKSQLTSAEFSEKGGAGLGLIELSRKSGQPLKYAFEEVDEQLAMFHQQVTFKNDANKDVEINQIDHTGSLLRMMNEKQWLLYYKGDFSQKSILPMLDIVEYNVGAGHTTGSIGRKAGHVLVELLQNVSKHSTQNGDEEKEGIFAVGRHHERLFVECGNIVSMEEKRLLEGKLSFLQSMNSEELREMHKAAMKASLKFESKNKSGLGLIEIAKAAYYPPVFRFEKITDQTYFFAIHVMI